MDSVKTVDLGRQFGQVCLIIFNYNSPFRIHKILDQLLNTVGSIKDWNREM